MLEWLIPVLSCLFVGTTIGAWVLVSRMIKSWWIKRKIDQDGR